MNYKELLEEIKDIRKGLTRLEDDATLSDQAETLQEVFEKQEEYKTLIENLEEKLANPEEYYALYATDTTKSRVEEIENHISSMDVSDKQLEADIANANYRLQVIANDLIEYEDLIAIGEQEIAEYEQANNEDKSAEEIVAIEDSVRKTRAAIEEIHAYMDALELERESLTNAINSTTIRRTQLAESRARYERLLTLGQTAIEKGFIIDRDKMRADQASLEEYRQNLRAYDAQEAYLSFNCVNELEDLEGHIRKEDMDKDQILDRLQEIREHAPYLPVDSAEEIAENQKAQQTCQARIEELQTKLENNENYVISETSFDKLNQEIRDLEMRKSAYEVREKENDASLAQKTRDKVNTEDEIDELNKDLADLEHTIASVEVKLAADNLSKRVRREYEIDLNSCRKEAADIRKKLGTLNADAESLKTQVNMAKEEQKRISKLQAGVDKVLKLKRERLEDKKTIDTFAKRNDVEELDNLKASLSALKSREDYLLSNMPDKLETLVTTLQNEELISKKETEEKALITDIKHQAQKVAEKVMIGQAVLFEKFNNSKLVQKIKSFSFKQKVIAGLSAAAMVVALAGGGVAAFKSWKNSKDKVAINRGGLSVEAFKVPKFDEEQLAAHKLQIHDRVFTYVDLEQNEDLIKDETNKDVENNEEIEDTVQTEKKSFEEVAKEVIRGKWGNGQDRKNRLKEAGYSDEEIVQIQTQVNAFYKPQNETEKDAGTTVIEDQTKPVEKEEEPVLPPEAFEPDHIYIPQAPIQQPIQTPEIPGVQRPNIIIQGPTYTIDGDEIITGEEFHPIVTPEPEEPSKTTIDVKVGKGDTLVVDTAKGKVAVDNSDGANYLDLEEGTSLDYTSSSTIDSVRYNDKDESVQVTIDKSEVTPTTIEQKELDQQILDDYEQILREMGISSTTLEDTGRTR